jgi:hypothetical protein
MTVRGGLRRRLISVLRWRLGAILEPSYSDISDQAKLNLAHHSIAVVIHTRGPKSLHSDDGQNFKGLVRR